MNDSRNPLGSPRMHRRIGPRDGFSLMEMMLVLTVMAVLIAMCAPTYQKALEQARADLAAANLRAIWSAERLYWLGNQNYTNDLSQLQTLGLVDPSVVSATTTFVYAVTAADANTFQVTATRTGSSIWSGEFSIDQTGIISGTIAAPGEAGIQPGFQ